MHGGTELSRVDRDQPAWDGRRGRVPVVEPGVAMEGHDVACCRTQGRIDRGHKSIQGLDLVGSEVLVDSWIFQSIIELASNRAERSDTNVVAAAQSVKGRYLGPLRRIGRGGLGFSGSPFITFS